MLRAYDCSTVCPYHMVDISEPSQIGSRCTRFDLIPKLYNVVYNKCKKIEPDLLMLVNDLEYWLES